MTFFALLVGDYICSICPYSAHKLYPVRVRFVNDLSDAITWMTVAYIPVVRTMMETSAKERSRLRRCGVLQRALYACMRTAMAASHEGAQVRVSGRVFTAFPRVLLYVCDQLEERAVLCFKTGSCQRPCSQCDVHMDVVGSVHALSAAERDVVEMLEHQLEVAGHKLYDRERERRETLEAADSLTGFVPALAGMAGLSTPPYLLYKMIGFDALHVRWPRTLRTRWWFLCLRSTLPVMGSALALKACAAYVQFLTEGLSHAALFLRWSAGA